MNKSKLVDDTNRFVMSTSTEIPNGPTPTNPLIASPKANSIKPRARPTGRRGGDPKQAAHEPWGDYHFLLALMALIGVVWANHSVTLLIHYVEHLNVLEESGLAACVMVVLSRVVQAIRAATKTIARFWGY